MTIHALHATMASRTSTLHRTAACLGALLAAQAASAQTWTRVARNPPSGVNLMLLLSDGTVMAASKPATGFGSGWYRLTPDIHGSYVNGTWTTLASMPHTRLYYQTQVLRDGRVYVSGGEYGTGGPFAEIYNPLTNSWSGATPPTSLWSTATDNFYDCNSEMLPDGSVLLMPVFPHTPGIGLRYNPATNAWSNAGRLFRGSFQDETSWVKLPDNTILTIDPFGTLSERYNPATNTWINDGVVPVQLFDPFGSELGGALLLPNGKAFYLGSTGHTALYTPSGSLAPGIWVAGPDIPGAHGTPDAPAALMPNGKVLCAVSAIPTDLNHFPSPTSFYEYDYATNSFASVNGPTGATLPVAAYQTAMLALPSGEVLLSRMNNNVYVYRPVGQPLPEWRPLITSVTHNPDGTYRITGKRLNGISAGATYGDDYQMNTNYPIVRLTNLDTSNVYYARTFSWSSTGVMTGDLTVTTEFSIPASVPNGPYQVVVSASGVASEPFCLGAPSIGAGPAVARTCQQGAVALAVSASGFGPLTYQWFRGEVPLADAGPFSGAATPTLLISPVDASASGADYRCVVANACGSTVSVDMAVVICAADFNCDGLVDPDDLSDFIACFFETPSCTRAEFNLDGVIDPDDISDYLGVFFGGC